MFELVTFGTNYGLQTANETVTRCPNVALQYLLEVIDTLVFFSANLAFQKTRHNSPTNWYPEILVAIVRWKLSEEHHFVTIYGWRVLSAMVLSPVGMSKVWGQNFFVPKALIPPPEFVRDNIGHLF